MDDGNLEEVLLELNKFEKKAQQPNGVEGNGPTSNHGAHISPVLEEYLQSVATTGATHFPWSKIKPLFRTKLEDVIEEFQNFSPADDLPAVPNVDAFSFAACREKVFQQLDCFGGIPFTVQRLCELLTAPRRHYKRTDKFMRALEKNMLVVSTVDPKAPSSTSSETKVPATPSSATASPVKASPSPLSASIDSKVVVPTSTTANNSAPVSADPKESPSSSESEDAKEASSSSPSSATDDEPTKDEAATSEETPSESSPAKVAKLEDSVKEEEEPASSSSPLRNEDDGVSGEPSSSSPTPPEVTAESNLKEETKEEGEEEPMSTEQEEASSDAAGKEEEPPSSTSPVKQFNRDEKEEEGAADQGCTDAAPLLQDS